MYYSVISITYAKNACTYEKNNSRYVGYDIVKPAKSRPVLMIRTQRMKRRKRH